LLPLKKKNLFKLREKSLYTIYDKLSERITLTDFSSGPTTRDTLSESLLFSERLEQTVIDP